VASSPRHGCSATRAARANARRRPGFTLIETALATVIIGVGVVAIVEAQESFMRSNSWSSQSATAAFLGNEIRELSRTCTRHDPVTGLFLADDGNGGQVLHGWGAENGEDIVADFDDIDDLDALTFGSGGDFPGPIDAFGAVVPQTLPDGTVLLDEDGDPVPLAGWSQTVTVEKVSPTDFATVLADNFRDNPDPDAEWRDVDDFPLRVTVVVEYQGPFDNSPREITRVIWIVP
jgi:prepilin-type N-terminal cleavage/methylation domain-containing protein